MKAIIAFMDDNGYVMKDHEAKKVITKELERLSTACPRHTEFNTACGVCERMSDWTIHRKVEYLIKLLLP